tara:strand:- start:167 stop:274 length:108 start_codon:yes stop_codon:yes gene_type:complete
MNDKQIKNEIFKHNELNKEGFKTEIKRSDENVKYK